MELHCTQNAHTKISWQVLVEVLCMVHAASDISRHMYQSVGAATKATFLKLLSLVDESNDIRLLPSYEIITVFLKKTIIY